LENYYAQKLSADRLKRLYEIGSPRIKRYLEAEIRHVLDRLVNGESVLELGCGYGRILKGLASKAGLLVGVDNALASLQMAAREGGGRYALALMNAVQLGFSDNVFNVTLCLQNGISAFKVDQAALIKEAIRVTCSGGRVFFSSYVEAFWPDRLDWFRQQAEEGLLGPIDEEATGDGVIVCRDGFRATTLSPADFERLTSGLAGTVQIYMVDNSSLFCEIEPV